MQKYETIFVIDSLLKSEEIDAIIAKYEKFISANGGKIDVIEQWGKKRLAYEIKKRQYGYYVLIRFDAPGTIVKQLEREYRLNESILRYMTLRLNKQALKMLEKQQRSAPAAAPEAPKETPENDNQEQKETVEINTSPEPEAGELSVEQPENSGEEEPAENIPESEAPVEAESALAEEPTSPSVNAVEDRTKTE